MKPAKFDYAKAGDGAEAVRLLGASDGFNKPLGGGMSLGPMMNLRLAQPDMVVEVRGIEALSQYEDRGDHAVRERIENAMPSLDTESAKKIAAECSSANPVDWHLED